MDPAAALAERRIAIFHNRPITADQFTSSAPVRLQALGLDANGEQAAADAFMSGERQRRIFKTILEVLEANEFFEPGTASNPRLRLEVIPDLMLGAFATPPDSSGSYLIVYSQGLSMLVYGVIRSLTTLFVERGNLDDRAAHLDDVAYLAANQLDWATSIAARPGSPKFQPTLRQLQAASDFATAAEAFVLAHELAHIALGHHSEAYRRNVQIGDTLVPASEYEHAREFDADLHAMVFLAELSAARKWPFEELYAGVASFFQIHRLIEEFAGQHDVTSHPPAMSRLAAVEDMVERRMEIIPDEPWRRPQEAFQLTRQIDRMMDDLRPRILQWAPTRRVQSGETRSAAVQQSFRELLHSVQSEADEKRFLAETWRLLDVSPSALLDVIRSEYALARGNAATGGNSCTLQLLERLRTELGADITAALDGLQASL